MNLTSTEIFKLVWDRIRDSLLGKTVPMMYADHYPNNPSGEFIVVGSLIKCRRRFAGGNRKCKHLCTGHNTDNRS